MQPNRPAKPQPKAKPKDPKIAVALSLVVPGAGQLYLGATAKGLAFMAGIGAVFANVMYGAVQAVTAVSETGDVERAISEASSLGLGTMLVLGAITAAAMADAWVSAKKLQG